MKKIIISVALGGFIVGAIISPIVGMAISSTRDLILGMSPDEAILALADKIDEESGKNEEQESLILELEEKNRINSEIQKEQLNREKKECLERVASFDSIIASTKSWYEEEKSKNGDPKDIQDLKDGLEKHINNKNEYLRKNNNCEF